MEKPWEITEDSIMLLLESMNNSCQNANQSDLDARPYYYVLIGL